MALTEEQKIRREELLRRKQERSEGNAPMTGFQKFDKKAIEIQERASKAQEKAAEEQKEATLEERREEISRNLNKQRVPRMSNSNPGGFTSIASHIERHTSDRGTYFLVLAFIIFLVDLSTSFLGIFPLGPSYAGFEWVWGFDFVNILTNIIASGIFATFALFFVITKIARRDLQALGAEAVSFGIFAIVMTFFILNNNWIGTPKAVIHFIFILLFSFTFIRTNEDAPAFYIFTTVLLLVDFFGYTLLSNLVVLRYIPFLLVFVIFYVYGKTQNAWSILFVIFLITVLFIFSYKDVKAQGGDFSFIAKNDAPTLEQTKDDFLKGVQNFYKSWQISLQSQIQYAITGKVEKNQYEPLGVYLENVKSADAKYYENEDVVVWGTIRAKTLDDPINVKLGCYARDGTKKIETKNVDPNATFPVFKLEEQDFACNFKNTDFKGILKSGSNTITAFADFNFETLAFLKVYFMDRERLRAMTRENLDPFVEFKIKDKKPVTIFTNGPAAIGMETTSPLIGVGESYIAFPTLSMSIQNNQGWQGRIKKFEEVILLLPKGVGLTSPESDCGERKFIPYDTGQCKQNSCKKVHNECVNVCEKGYAKVSDKDNCVVSCKDKLTACEKDCDFLFEEEGQQYLGFSLDENNLKEINNKLAKDDAPTKNFEFFRCRLSPNLEVLQDTPITTKSIRAKIRYNYNVEKPVSVTINKLTDAERTRKIGDIAAIPTTELGKRVVNLASQAGVPQDLAFALVSKESSFTHCCGEQYEFEGTCRKSNAENCKLSQLISSGSSYGITQLNLKHCAWFNPEKVCNQGSIQDLSCFSGYKDPNTGGWKEECDIFRQANCAAGQDATYLDCNIKLGSTYLKKLYEGNKGKTRIWPCNNKAYSGWDLALRYYNGWGCAGADFTYVERINEIRQEISAKVALQELENNPPTASSSEQTPISEGEIST